MLNTNEAFYVAMANHFNEADENIQSAFESIARSIVYAINIQCDANNRMEEICKIAKECASIKFDPACDLNNFQFILKGDGANAEIFNNSYCNLVDLVAKYSNVKSSAVKRIFAILTPLTLAFLFKINAANNFKKEQLCQYLKNLNMTNKRMPREIKNELNALKKITSPSRAEKIFGSSIMEAWRSASHLQNIFSKKFIKA